jgi:hypothetical protein
VLVELGDPAFVPDLDEIDLLRPNAGALPPVPIEHMERNEAAIATAAVIAAVH